MLEVSIEEVPGYEELEEEAEWPVLCSFANEGRAGDAGEDEFDPRL